MNNKKTALFVSGRTFNLVRSRLPLMSHLQIIGWRVVGAARSQKMLDELLINSGIEFINVPFYRFSLSPIKDSLATFYLARLIRRLNPSLIHLFNPKPIFLGGIALRFLKTKAVRICTLTGIGLDNKDGLRNYLIRLFYRFSLKYLDAIIFENYDNLNYFIKNKLVDSTKCYVQISSGVNITNFNHRATTTSDNVKIFFASRLLWSKGVYELTEAAKILRKEFGGRVNFIFAGEFEMGHRDEVPMDFISELHNKSVISYVGKISLDKMPQLILEADIIVLPSYREGMSKFLMEGAAAGKPLIASDIPGCKEIVHSHINGLLCKPKDVTSLVEALRKLISNPELRISYGRASRLLAESDFDEKIIVQKTLQIYRDSGVSL